MQQLLVTPGALTLVLSAIILGIAFAALFWLLHRLSGRLAQLESASQDHSQALATQEKLFLSAEQRRDERQTEFAAEVAERLKRIESGSDEALQAIAAQEGLVHELGKQAEQIAGQLRRRKGFEKRTREQLDEVQRASETATRRMRLVYNLLQPVSWATAPLLVTGCGRSGTHYLAAALRSLGLDVEHEVPAADATVSWIHAPPRFREEQGLSFSCVLHMHREPLASISSILTFHERSWIHVERYLPRCIDEDPLARAAQYWLHWNRLAEEQASWSFAVERLAEPAVQDRFQELSGIALTEEALLAGRAAQNSRRQRDSYRPIGWPELRALLKEDDYRDLLHQARRYGYEAPNEM